MKKTLVLVFLLLGVLSAWAQTENKGTTPEETTLQLSPFWVQVTPALAIPVGDSSNNFSLGGDASIIGEYRLPFMPQALARAELEYNYSPIPARQTVSFTSLALGVGYSYNFIPSIGVKAFADGGATYGFFNSTFEGYWNPFVKAGLDLYWTFPPRLTIDLGASFLYQIGLYTGVGVFLGASYGMGKPITVQKFKAPRPEGLPGKPKLLLKPGTGVQFAKIDLNDIYPVFYKFYDDHPIGTAVLHNWEKSTVENVRVSVFVKEYMTDPKEVKGPDTIAAGTDTTIDLYGLFTKDVLSNTESTKVSAHLTVRYTMNGNLVESDTVQTLQVLRRNSLTWDDDRKAAAFVSANDPTAVKFAKNVQSMVQPKTNPVIDPSLQLAMAMHEALTLYGLTYSNDPVATLNSDNKTVDYIQFPQQTLDYKGGKCSDFSVLYASMLEAIGVETAFITIPGHIYMAVALQMSPDIARKTFQNSDDLIYQSNKVWLPIEITLRDGGFLKAWQLGAKEYRENQGKNQAQFYPLHDAWSIYQPVGYSSAESNIRIPDQDKVVQQFSDEQVAFVNMEIGQQESALLAAANKADNKAKALNTLSVLYSRYGLFDKAQKVLQQVLAKEEFVPALVNMGNIYFLRSQMDNALEYYNRAFKKDPNNPIVLLCVARTNHAQENWGMAKKAYAQLQAVDPDLAQKFSYLGLRGEEATRAADASGLQKVVVWQESNE
jgi:tetratricopeptide (TPR) repeat protein